MPRNKRQLVPPNKLKKSNRRKRLDQPAPRYGRKQKARFSTRGYGWRGKATQLTTHPIRVKQYPKLSKRKRKDVHGTEVFTAKPSKKFIYLPHVPKRRQLGHPIALGDDMVVVFDFKPDTNTRYLINQHFGTQIRRVQWRARYRRTLANVNQVKLDLRVVARHYFQKILIAMFEMIDILVPKATGRLRAGMKANLNRCIKRLNLMPYILKLNTLDALENPIYYANPVNNMPTEWLAHPHMIIVGQVHGQPVGVMRDKQYFKGLGKWVDLYDPDAETDWYTKILEFGRTFARNNTGMLYHEISKIYGVHPITRTIYQAVLNSLKFS